MFNTPSLIPLAFVALVPAVALAKADCPATVTQVARKAYPAAKVASCNKEKTGDKLQYEVTLQTKNDGKIELDISPQGSIVLTEEKVGIETLPKEVMAAFEAKCPKAKATVADKQTKPDQSVTYEIAFEQKGQKREATFRSDGEFVEEE